MNAPSTRTNAKIEMVATAGGISSMARKKGLAEIKALGGTRGKDTKGKVKEEGIFGYSQSWEAGEIVDEEDGEEYWDYLLPDGTLEECLEAIAPHLSMETFMENKKFVHDGDSFSVEGHFERMGKMRDQKFEAIKKECLTKGECKGDGWLIRSQRNKQECEWMKSNGYPYVG